MISGLRNFEQREIIYGGVTFKVRRTMHKQGGKFVLMHNDRYLARFPAKSLRVWLKYFSRELSQKG